MAYFIDTVGADYAKQPLGQKMHTIQELLEIIGNIDSTLKQDILLQRTSQVTGLPHASLSRELSRLQDTAKPYSPASFAHETKNTTVGQVDDLLYSQITLLEKKIFSAIISRIELLQRMDGAYLCNYVRPPLNEIVDQLKVNMKEGNTLSFHDLFYTLSETQQQLVSRILLECEEEDVVGQFDQLLIEFQKRNWKLIVQDLKGKLAKAESEKNENQAQEILTLFQELKQRLVHKGIS